MCEALESVPDPFRQLNALQSLYLSCCTALEAWPDWLHVCVCVNVCLHACTRARLVSPLFLIVLGASFVHDIPTFVHVVGTYAVRMHHSWMHACLRARTHAHTAGVSLALLVETNAVTCAYARHLVIRACVHAYMNRGQRLHQACMHACVHAYTQFMCNFSHPIPPPQASLGACGRWGVRPRDA